MFHRAAALLRIAMTSRRCSRCSTGKSSSPFAGRKPWRKRGETVNVPANAPHAFVNASGLPARLLCLCAPAGQEEFFMAIGDPVASRTAPPPTIGKAEQAERIENAKALAPQYRTELLIP